MEQNNNNPISTITKIHDVIDIWSSDPLLGPYIEKLQINPYIPSRVVETFLFSLIRDGDTLIFSLLNNSFQNLSDQAKKELSSVVLNFAEENKLIENIRIKLLNSPSSKGTGVLSQLLPYFSSLAGSAFPQSSAPKFVPTLFSWKGAGVHFVQLLLVLQEKKWLDFSINDDESQKEFASKIHSSIDFVSSYTSDSLYRDLKPNDSEPDISFKDRYAKAFAGGDFFSRIRDNKSKGVRKTSKTKSS